jgi:hypothetical protein
VANSERDGREVSSGHNFAALVPGNAAREDGIRPNAKSDSSHGSNVVISSAPNATGEA